MNFWAIVSLSSSGLLDADFGFRTLYAVSTGWS